MYGYRGGRFLTSDPLRGPALWLSEAELMNLWHFYNGEYLVAYPPARGGGAGRGRQLRPGGSAGPATLYYLYCQEAFEAWTKAGQPRKTSTSRSAR